MEPPRFPDAPLPTVRAAPGASACLSQPLPSGTPPFHYTWSRADTSLDGRFTVSDDAGGVRLTISSAQTTDSGVYTLQATNASGAATARARLEVSPDEAPSGTDPPTFLRRLQDLTVRVGTRTRLLVEILSETQCKVTWYRNERRLLEAERVALVEDGNFWCADVAAVSVDDAGRWTCTAENAGGRASCSAHLNVLVPKAYKRPEFVEELRALLTEQGTVSLECKVVGVPTPVLRWFKDSREIKAGDVFALTANAEDPTSLGTYTCEAVNCMGRAYSSSKVHVLGRASGDGSRPASSLSLDPPPIFTKELEDQHAKICEPMTLGCQIVVPPWPRCVVWYNKEGKIENGDRYHVLEDGVGGYMLEIPSAEYPDEGEWKCVATTSGGRVGISSCYVTMDVPKNYRKPRFMENLQAVLTEEGLVSFECKVVGFPTPVLTWFKDGQELKPGDVYQLTGTNSLGSYCCIARNCMGHARSSAELTVEDIQNQLNVEEKLHLFSKNQAPNFITGLKSVEAKIDEPFRFTVKVAIPPEPSVLWYRDDQPVDESSRNHLGTEEKGIFFLDIQNLEFLDQAEWKCVAMNDFGHSVTSCFLKLIIPRHYKKPRFLENLQAILSEEGAVNLECKVIGVPQPILKWYKDGEELKPGDIHRIISGQDGTCCLGTYTCEAQNCMGIAASSASLLGFEDSMKAKAKKLEEQALQRNLSLSTIHEERTSQMYDTPVGDITLDEKGEISFSFDGKEVSVSLYETPDLTEEEALQIVEMYADQLSENVTEHNVVELPPLRFVKETSTSGNLLMEAIIIDVSPEYFASTEEDLRTEADVEDISIADENGPPQLSLDTDIGGEDYLEKTMALLSDEKSDLPKKNLRKKSDSQRSVEDYFSLSREQSFSEEKRDDDTQVISETELMSFASARSSTKQKSRISKQSFEEAYDLAETPKPMEIKEEPQKRSLETDSPVTPRPKRERRTSRSSRRSSSGSEKSFSKLKAEEAREQITAIESLSKESMLLPTITDEECKNKTTIMSTLLSKVINDIQIVERDIILKSELMSSAATASRSLEIIGNLIAPLSEIQSMSDATKELVADVKELSSAMFNRLPHSLKNLQQSLAMIEKCIEVESDSKTLVKKTCVAFIETCGEEMQQLLKEIRSITKTRYLNLDDKTITEIEMLTGEMTTVLKLSADTIKTKQLLSEASEIKIDEPTFEAKHLRDTQKAVFELRSPVNSLLCIAESAETGKIIDVSKVKTSDIIMNDMSASIQDLQTALEQIELLSVKESTTALHKYNTEIIETVMESVLKLRSSFELLSTETRTEENKDVLTGTLISIKQNLSEISSHIDTIEKNVGPLDILQSENKLEVLQKMAQILIALENNLPNLETLPEIKTHMDIFHKNLTKVLENVIESNDGKKYFALLQICDVVNRMNTSIKTIDTDILLSLASLSNTVKIIQDHIISNVFQSELNCAMLSNIADILVGVQEAINHAEEISINVDSEHLQDLSIKEFDINKANVIVEHINQTICAITNVKSMEATVELKAAIAPTLESICPILEELKRYVATSRVEKTEMEHVSVMSDFSMAETLAAPLCELNQNIIILNQMIIENIEHIKDSGEIVSTIAEPLHELHTTLEVLQQDVISQYGEELTPYDVSVNMASAVQNLQSCILMIQEQAGIEGVDEMSTLEDVSGIKTTADTILEELLFAPSVAETPVEQGLVSLNESPPLSETAQELNTLNEHLTVLKTPEILDALDTLSEVSDYSSLKSVAVGLGELYSGIEEILHPVVMESSTELSNLINPSKLISIAVPMQELQQYLSVLDINNIPIYEHILEMPMEKIHSVFESITQFKTQLDKCLQVIFPVMENANKDIEITQKVECLREVCENMKETIESTTFAKEHKETLESLGKCVQCLLEATEESKKLKIERVKCIAQELYDKIQHTELDMIQFTPMTPEKLAQEAKFFQSVSEVEKNIAVLEQFDFVDLSKVSDITPCTTPQLAMELEVDSLLQIDDVFENAVNVLQYSVKEMPVADLMIVEDFFKTCKSEFTILRCLVAKPLGHKKLIRVLQEFTNLQISINDFKIKCLDLNLTEEIKNNLVTFMIHADDCLKNVQESLIKMIDSQSELLFKMPAEKLDNNLKSLHAYIKEERTFVIKNIVEHFITLSETALGFVVNLDMIMKDELTNPNLIQTKPEERKLVKYVEDFEIIIENEIRSQPVDSSNKQMLTELIDCLHKHQDYKDAIGSGKPLIVIKCLAECSDILQDKVLQSKPTQDSIKEIEIKESILNNILSEMLGPLQAFQSQIKNIQLKIISDPHDESASLDVSTTDSFVHTMTEIHKEIAQIEQNIISEGSVVHNDDISLLMEVDKEILTIQDSIKAIDNMPSIEKLKELSKPIEDIGQTLHSILSSELVRTESKNRLVAVKTADLSQVLEKYVSSDIVNALDEIYRVIEVNELKQSIELARELKDNIAAMNSASESEIIDEAISTQTRLEQELQNALSVVQVQAIQNTEKLRNVIDATQLNKINDVVAELQAEVSYAIMIAPEMKISTGPDIVEEVASSMMQEVKSDHITEKVEVLDRPIAVQSADLSKVLVKYVSSEIVNALDKISTVIEVNELKKSIELACELNDNIAAMNSATESEIIDEPIKKQTRLEQELQKALSVVQVQAIQNTEKLRNVIDATELNKINNVVAELLAEISHAIMIAPEVKISTGPDIVEEVASSMMKVVKSEDITEKVEVPDRPIAVQSADLSQVLEKYVSSEIVNALEEITTVIEVNELKQSIELARELKDNIASMNSATESEIIEKTTRLEQELQNALSVVQVQAIQNTEKLCNVIDASELNKINNVVAELQAEVSHAIMIATEVKISTGPYIVKEVASSMMKVEVPDRPIAEESADLSQVLEKYVSSEIVNALEEISTVIEVNELKQSIELARELKDNIAAMNSATESEIIEKTTRLEQELQNALSVVQVQAIQNTEKLCNVIDATQLNKINAVVAELQEEVSHAIMIAPEVKISNNLDENPEIEIKSADTLPAEALIQVLEEVISETNLISDLEVESSKRKSVETTTVTQEGEIAEVVETVALAEDITQQNIIPESIAVIQEMEPVIVEDVASSMMSVVKSEEITEKVEVFDRPVAGSESNIKSDTLLLCIEKYISSPFAGVVTELATLTHTEELMKSIDLACELHEQLGVLKTAEEVEIMPVQISQELHCALSAVQATLLQYANELSESVQIETLNELSFLTATLQAYTFNIIQLNKHTIEDINILSTNDSILEQINKFRSINEAQIDNISENIPDIEVISKPDIMIKEETSGREIENCTTRGTAKLVETESTLQHTDTVKQSMETLQKHLQHYTSDIGRILTEAPEEGEIKEIKQSLQIARELYESVIDTPSESLSLPNELTAQKLNTALKVILTQLSESVPHFSDDIRVNNLQIIKANVVQLLDSLACIITTQTHSVTFHKLSENNKDAVLYSITNIKQNAELTFPAAQLSEENFLNIAAQNEQITNINLQHYNDKNELPVKMMEEINTIDKKVIAETETSLIPEKFSQMQNIQQGEENCQTCDSTIMKEETVHIEELNLEGASLTNHLAQEDSKIVKSSHEIDQPTEVIEIKDKLEDNEIINNRIKKTPILNVHESTLTTATAHVTEPIIDIMEELPISIIDKSSVLTKDEEKINENAIPGSTINTTEKCDTIIKNEPVMDKSIVTLLQHIDDFVSSDITDVVGELSKIVQDKQITETFAIARELREKIEASEIINVCELNGELSESLKVVQAQQEALAQQLQLSLEVLQEYALNSAQEFQSPIAVDSLQKVSDAVIHLQNDLLSAKIVHVKNDLMPLHSISGKSDDTASVESEGDNTMKRLEGLLQEVSDKIDLSSTDKNSENTESLRDSLDEVQTVIIKLRRDYDGVENESLNETLEDLECSVRSVQLQINEESPPELLKEACATLQLLVNNIHETQEVEFIETITKGVNKSDKMLEKCSDETQETVDLLENATVLDVKDTSQLSHIISNINFLRETLKSLRLSFLGNAESLIERGIEVNLNLEQIEEKVFLLEKDLVSEQSIKTETKEKINSAIHAIFGSISNMRSTILSIQKQYMYENYGKPSEGLLKSVKIVSNFGKREENVDLKRKWKNLSVSLRNVIIHFEDIKFYVNLDKTARIPSDSGLTKCVLEELKSNITAAIWPLKKYIEDSTNEKIDHLIHCLATNILNIDSRSTLEVKEKIPIFKNIASQIFDVTETLQNELQLLKEKGVILNESKEICELDKVETSDLHLSSTSETMESLVKLESLPRNITKTEVMESVRQTEDLPCTSTVDEDLTKFEIEKDKLSESVMGYSASEHIPLEESISEEQGEICLQQATNMSIEDLEKASQSIDAIVKLENTESVPSTSKMTETEVECLLIEKINEKDANSVVNLESSMLTEAPSSISEIKDNLDSLVNIINKDTIESDKSIEVQPSTIKVTEDVPVSEPTLSQSTYEILESEPKTKAESELNDQEKRKSDVELETSTVTVEDIKTEEPSSTSEIKDDLEAIGNIINSSILEKSIKVQPSTSKVTEDLPVSVMKNKILSMEPTFSQSANQNLESEPKIKEDLELIVQGKNKSLMEESTKEVIENIEIVLAAKLESLGMIPSTSQISEQNIKSSEIEKEDNDGVVEPKADTKILKTKENEENVEEDINETVLKAEIVAVIEPKEDTMMIKERKRKEGEEDASHIEKNQNIDATLSTNIVTESKNPPETVSDALLLHEFKPETKIYLETETEIIPDLKCIDETEADPSTSQNILEQKTTHKVANVSVKHNIAETTTETTVAHEENKLESSQIITEITDKVKEYEKILDDVISEQQNSYSLEDTEKETESLKSQLVLEDDTVIRTEGNSLIDTKDLAVVSDEGTLISQKDKKVSLKELVEKDVQSKDNEKQKNKDEENEEVSAILKTIDTCQADSIIMTDDACELSNLEIANDDVICLTQNKEMSANEKIIHEVITLQSSSNIYDPDQQANDEISDLHDLLTENLTAPKVVEAKKKDTKLVTEISQLVLQPVIDEVFPSTSNEDQREKQIKSVDHSANLVIENDLKLKKEEDSNLSCAAVFEISTEKGTQVAEKDIILTLADTVSNENVSIISSVRKKGIKKQKDSISSKKIGISTDTVKEISASEGKPTDNIKEIHARGDIPTDAIEEISKMKETQIKIAETDENLSSETGKSLEAIKKTKQSETDASSNLLQPKAELITTIDETMLQETVSEMKISDEFVKDAIKPQLEEFKLISAIKEATIKIENIDMVPSTSQTIEATTPLYKQIDVIPLDGDIKTDDDLLKESETLHPELRQNKSEPTNQPIEENVVIATVSSDAQLVSIADIEKPNLVKDIPPTTETLEDFESNIGPVKELKSKKIRQKLLKKVSDDDIKLSTKNQGIDSESQPKVETEKQPNIEDNMQTETTIDNSEFTKIISTKTDEKEGTEINDDAKEIVQKCLKQKVQKGKESSMQQDIFSPPSLLQNTETKRIDDDLKLRQKDEERLAQDEQRKIESSMTQEKLLQSTETKRIDDDLKLKKKEREIIAHGQQNEILQSAERDKLKEKILQSTETKRVDNEQILKKKNEEKLAQHGQKSNKVSMDQEKLFLDGDQKSMNDLQLKNKDKEKHEQGEKEENAFSIDQNADVKSIEDDLKLKQENEQIEKRLKEMEEFEKKQREFKLQEKKEKAAKKVARIEEIQKKKKEDQQKKDDEAKLQAQQEAESKQIKERKEKEQLPKRALFVEEEQKSVMEIAQKQNQESNVIENRQQQQTVEQEVAKSDVENISRTLESISIESNDNLDMKIMRKSKEESLSESIQPIDVQRRKKIENVDEPHSSKNISETINEKNKLQDDALLKSTKDIEQKWQTRRKSKDETVMNSHGDKNAHENTKEKKTEEQIKSKLEKTVSQKEVIYDKKYAHLENEIEPQHQDQPYSKQATSTNYRGDLITKHHSSATRLDSTQNGAYSKHSIDRTETRHRTDKTSYEQSYAERHIKTEHTSVDEKYVRKDDISHSSGGRKPTDEKEKPKFVDHSHRDYTMEFARPSSYRERLIETNCLGSDSTAFDRRGAGTPIYKVTSLVQEAQLRSSLPPSPVFRRSAEPSEMKPEVRHRTKAASEARSILTEKRSGTRDSKRKPVFSTHLTDRTAVEGSRVKLTCSILSSTDPKVTWYQNGVAITNKLKYKTKITEGLITLEVLNAVPSDSAEYCCTAENENGSVSTSAILKVYPSYEASPIPPTFTRSIRDTYHLAENELVLECRIRGQPLPTIYWLKDEKKIENSERYQSYYLADGVCRLAICCPTTQDSGKYTCKAESSVWSDQITHVVNFTGRERLLSPNITTVEKSRFSRQAMESRRPHFANVLSDHTVSKGGTIGLQVEIRGDPSKVEWLREGRSITEHYRNASAFVEHGLYTLALTDVTEKESGTYTCRAWSSHGTVDMNAAITVVQPSDIDGKPAIIAGRPEKDILISVGEDVNISFRVQGEPKPKVIFMKGTRDITSSQRVCKMTSDDYVKFTLKRSVVSDAGTYCVLARNAYGCDRAFVTVVVRQRASSDNLISDWTYPLNESSVSYSDKGYKSVPDRIPGEPTVVEGGNNWVSLTWSKPDPQDAAPVLAYKVEGWLLGKEGGARWAELGITPLNSYDVFNLKQGEEYHFRITPKNRNGWGEPTQTTNPIAVGLGGERPEFPVALPGQHKVLVGQKAELACSVIGKPTPEIVWMKNGHELEEEAGRVKTSFNGHNCILSIHEIRPDDDGHYSCEATNEHGRASSYARVAVVTDRVIWEADVKLKRERSSSSGDGEYPPQFTMRLRDRRVQATYPVRLTCQVVGKPPPAVTWFKDGEEVPHDSRHTRSQDELFHTLEIERTCLEDGGVYEAMTRNSRGAISCHCSLVVDKGIRAYVAPEFCCGLDPAYRINEGEELRVAAVVEAYPSVGIVWYREGVRLRPSRRAVMTLDRDGMVELAIASITPKDAGVYSCTASNEVGTATTSGRVEVIADGTVREEKIISPVLISPDVPYSTEPMFIRKPRSSEAREGDTVIIGCEVIGDPKPDVYWLRDFLKPDYYRDAIHFKRVGDGPEYRLEIPHAKLDYTGAYSVVATNVHGEAKAIISLQILAKDPDCADDAHSVRYGRMDVIPQIKRELQDLLCCDGDTVEFECQFEGKPEPEIKWYRYSELIHESDAYSQYYDGSTARLRISNVTPDDEGMYTCNASNALGSTNSTACLVVYPPHEPNMMSLRLQRPANLSGASTPRSTPRQTPSRSESITPIRMLGPQPPHNRALPMPPKFITVLNNKTVMEGQDAKFQCTVWGHPAPWVSWEKDGSKLSNSFRISLKERYDEKILQIDHVVPEDAGMYRITIENEHGMLQSYARLDVMTVQGKYIVGVNRTPTASTSEMTTKKSTMRQTDFSKWTPGQKNYNLSCPTDKLENKGSAVNLSLPNSERNIIKNTAAIEKKPEHNKSVNRKCVNQQLPFQPYCLPYLPSSRRGYPVRGYGCSGLEPHIESRNREIPCQITEANLLSTNKFPVDQETLYGTKGDWVSKFKKMWDLRQKCSNRIPRI